MLKTERADEEHNPIRTGAAPVGWIGNGLTSVAVQVTGQYHISVRKFYHHSLQLCFEISKISVEARNSAVWRLVEVSDNHLLAVIELDKHPERFEDTAGPGPLCHLQPYRLDPVPGCERDSSISAAVWSVLTAEAVAGQAQ